MKMSLLDMVQDILSDMNSDEVSSITDTLESLQVAQIIKSVYYELISRKNWPHTRKLLQLTPSGDSTKPTHMSVPDSIKEVVEINYDKRKTTDTSPKWRRVEYLHPDEFLRYTNGRNSSNSNIDEIEDYTGVELLIRNDAAPTYYTSFDDENLVFDSYDNTVDTTLQETKTQVIAYVIPTFTLSDTFTPDFPAEAFAGLLAEAKSVCFVRIKQMPDAKAEQQSRKQLGWLSVKNWQVDGGWRFPDYGRRSKK